MPARQLNDHRGLPAHGPNPLNDPVCPDSDNAWSWPSPGVQSRFARTFKEIPSSRNRSLAAGDWVWREGRAGLIDYQLVQVRS